MENNLESSSEIKSKITSFDPDISTSQIFSKAWDLIKGQKSRMWLVIFLYLFLYLVIFFLFNFVPQKLLKPSGLDTSNIAVNLPLIISSTLGTIVYWSLTVLLSEGIKIITIKAAQTKSFEMKDLFSCFPKALNVLLISLVSSVLIIIGFLLFIFPGIYLAIGYTFAVSLHIRKKLSIWDALETSRIQVTKHWFSVFFVTFFSILLNILGIFTLFIAWIWTVPIAWLTLGVLYTKLFEPEHDFKPTDQPSLSVEATNEEH
jgi:hypothetical protein